MCKRSTTHYNHLLLIASFNSLPCHNAKSWLTTVYFKRVNNTIRALLFRLHYTYVQKNYKIAHVTTARPADRYKT